MKFSATEIPGVFHIEIAPYVDERGFFARIFCPAEFAQAGIEFTPTQLNLSRNDLKYTLRGMHWQDAPFAESKIVRCMRGIIYDVVADIRPQSPTFRKWIARELSAQRGDALFIPEGCAHGFLTLADDCDVLYHMGRMYEPGKARGFRFDDPAFGVAWPHRPQIINAVDRNWPDFAI